MSTGKKNYTVSKVNSTFTHKLSPQGHDQLSNIGLCDPDILFDAYVEGCEKHGFNGDPLWSWLCDSFPDLREVTKANREAAEKILEKEYELANEHSRTKKNQKKKAQMPSKLAEIEALPDANGTDVIANHVVYRKDVNGHAEEFFARVYLKDGEIVKELVEPRTVPMKTAPSVDFYTKDYDSLQTLFDDPRIARAIRRLQATDLCRSERTCYARLILP